jgi:molybdenum cofactor cytidylyltransferase
MGNDLCAIILAAGSSSRMGCPKLFLPWAGTTILGQVLSTFAAAGLQEVVVVTGASHSQIESLTADLGGNTPIRTVFNPAHADGQMLDSIKTGLSALDASSRAALIGLGDQPQVQGETLRSIMAAFYRSSSPLVIPSYQNQRGHPWLVARPLWQAILDLPASTTARQFLRLYSRSVEYVNADESILQDVDTPDEYVRQRP